MNTKKKKKTKLGQKLIAALNEAVEVEKGERKPGRITPRILIEQPPAWSPEKIKKLRNTLRISQSGLANLLAVATETVSAWEQGVNEPSGLARRTLQILAMSPQLIEKLPKAV